MVGVFVDRRFELLAEREADTLRTANLRLHGEIEERRAIALELLATNTALTDTQAAMRTLLDNADQGFLTIAPDLLVGDQSSAACKTILGEIPAGRSIVDLLCPRAPHDTLSAMRTTLESAFRESSDFVRDLKLGLLPVAFDIADKSITASYKFLPDSGRLMLILTDVTQTKLLTEAVQCEHQRLEMIVLAVTEGEAFSTLVNDYRQFLTDELPRLLERIASPAGLGELRRGVHTYKGLLAQFSFHNSPRRLHEVETRLSATVAWTGRAALEAAGPDVLLAELERDLAGVTDALGPDFAPSGHRIILSQDQLQAIEQAARQTLASDEGRIASPTLRRLLQTLAGLGLLDVKAALALHGRGVPALAARLQKQLAPIRVEGDDARLPLERYGEFLRSLVHVFRNAVDHGIEVPEERLLGGKAADGSIRCEVHVGADSLEIAIADDGLGVDRPMLEDKLVAAGNGRAQVEGFSLEELMFREGLSSRSTASEVSGRGIGLAAVKAALDRLGGSVAVETERGAGTRVRFRLPTNPEVPAFDATAPERITA
jgi:two-component system chemotaxis sensor kinase CheA